MWVGVKKKRDVNIPCVGVVGILHSIEHINTNQNATEFVERTNRYRKFVDQMYHKSTEHGSPSQFSPAPVITFFTILLWPRMLLYQALVAARNEYITCIRAITSFELKVHRRAAHRNLQCG